MIEVKLLLALFLFNIFKSVLENKITPFRKYPLIDKDGYEVDTCDSEKKFIPLKEYISENAKVFCYVYFIDEDLPNFLRVNTIEKSKFDFFEYLDTIDVEHSQVGSYYFFKKKIK